MAWLKWALQPIGNRNYVSRKQYKRMYLARYVSTALVLLAAAIIEPQLWKLWLGILAVIVLLGVVSYYTLDKWAENATWKHFFSRYYTARSNVNKEEK